MTQTRDLELPPGFDELRSAAQDGPVELSRDGQRDIVVMSADHYDWLRAVAQRTHRTSMACAVVVAAVESAEMGQEHAPLDDLLA